MSLESWKQEYYPVPATEPKTAKAAIEHSLRKWKGLRPEALKKHGLEIVESAGIVLREQANRLKSDVFLIDAQSCALCVLFLEYKNDVEPCASCPLCIELGVPCDDDREAPFQKFSLRGDAEPMITALEATLQSELEKGS